MDRRILITGAGSGLGRALAEAALDDGARVLLTDWDAAAGELARLELAERIREAGGDVHRVAFLPLDVCDDVAWDSAREWCAREWSGLDVLVNNAGVASAGPIADIPMADWDWILDINLKGVIRGVRTFTPMFAAQGSGHIVNIASLAGLMNLANMASYNVTKAGVISLSETMRCELEPLGIRTTVVCPSFFQTNLADGMRTTDPSYELMARKAIAGELFPGPQLTAADVARKVLKAVDRRKFLLLPHVETRLLWALKRLAPTPFAKGLSAANSFVEKRFGTATPGRSRSSGRV